MIASTWKENEEIICEMIPSLLEAGDLTVGQAGRHALACPKQWQEHIVKVFGEAKADKEDLLVVTCNGYLETLRYMSVDASTTEDIVQILNEMVHESLKPHLSPNKRKRFSLGAGLEAVLRYRSTFSSYQEDFWPQLCAASTMYGNMPIFLEALQVYCKIPDVPMDDTNLEQLISVLSQNLSTSSHTLRNVSLRLLYDLYLRVHHKESEVIRTALVIENMSLDLQSARTVSMHVRNLSTLYKAVSTDPWLSAAIPHFCFGLFTFKLSQLWEDSINALREMCETKSGEEVILDLAFKWLESPAYLPGDAKIPKESDLLHLPLTQFQCSNLARIEKLAILKCQEKEAASKFLTVNYEEKHCTIPMAVSRAPFHALRVLKGIPQIAEKRSRRLVPMFLQWAGTSPTTESTISEDCIEDPMELDEATVQGRLGRNNRKAMLDLFCQFTNPRVLFKSHEVYNTLLTLLTNGDLEIQRAALKAVFSWKLEALKPYEENLMNLLDDSRFREEISTFLHAGSEEKGIQDEHCAELMPVLLRLLYGRMVSRSGTSSAKRGQATKRKSVLEALSRLPEEYLEMFVCIVLGPAADLKPIKTVEDVSQNLNHRHFTARKQVGIVNMMKDMLETLGSQLAFIVQPVIINALLYCLITSSRELAVATGSTSIYPSEGSSISLFRTVRQLGLQCLTLVFQTCSSADLQPYLPVIFSELICPRLEKLPIETAQSVSGMLHLFSTWASSPNTAIYLSAYSPNVMSVITECLDVKSAQDDVKLFVLERILKRTVSLAKMSEEPKEVEPANVSPKAILQYVLNPNLDAILKQVGNLLRKSPSKDLLTSAIQLVSMVAPIITGSSHIINLLDISTFLLSQPSHRVAPRSKGDLLQVLQHFIPLANLDEEEELQQRIFNNISSLFGYFKDRSNRVVLSEVLFALAQKDSDLLEVSDLSISLNSFSAHKVEEPDFDRRLRAFSAINEAKFRDFSEKQWRPLLYNMIFYVRDNEELAIRSNASFALRRFIEAQTNLKECAKPSPVNLLTNVLLPAIRSGASERSELVRTEYLSIVAHMVRHNPTWDDVSDMYVLLANNDEEASFFSNILHIQQHRRLRALRRLASEARQGHFGSVNVSHFLIPLIEHFIFDKAEDESAHNLAAETVSTIGALADRLEWPQFRAMFRRFSGYIQSKPDIEKTIIKLLGVIIDALDYATKIRQQNSSVRPSAPASSITDDLDVNFEKSTHSTLAKTLPKHDKLTNDLTQNLLPPLLKYLHNKDESTVSLRVPVAVSVVKLLKVLPEERLVEQLPPVLTDICHILRSRAQESRDLTRKTLVDISTLIGPACLGFVLSELRGSLARGYQLHVLSYTVHSILVSTASIYKPGDLDYCLPQLVSIIMDDIFGATGQEKDAEEYISKMKEVKSSKSYDSMELIAKTASVTHFIDLIRPLQTLLNEKLDLKMVKKVDELLRRMGVGLLRNEATQSRDMLVFCYEVIRNVYNTNDDSSRKTSKEDHRTKRFLVNLRGVKAGNSKSTSSYGYKLARFSLDALRAVLHKYDTLQTPANLTGFMPIIGDALLQAQEEVQISAFRLLATIIKVPLEEIDNSALVYISEAVKIIKDCISTNSEIAQAALKLVSAILRERRKVHIREQDLAYLLKRLKLDLEEPDRQGVTFNFVKAVMTRKVIIPEVYEVLDTVAAMMVTNQTKSARDLARGVYFQFLMDYPQGKDRLSKQLGFLVKNLDYKHIEGRQSVMEAIHLLISKVGDDLIQQLVGTFFVPLVMVVANDEDADCRKMAGALLKELFERADTDHTKKFLILLRTWLDQDKQALLTRVALQSYCIYIDVDGSGKQKELAGLETRLTHLIKKSLLNTRSDEWEVLYYTLQTTLKMCRDFPQSFFAAKCTPLWVGIRQCLHFPHAWVKLATTKLLGMYFADFARTNAEIDGPELPLKGSNGLRLGNEEMIQMSRASLGILRVPNTSEELAMQCVRNLIFLGRSMGNAGTLWKSGQQYPDRGKGEKSDEDSEDIASDAESLDNSQKTALQYIFERISAILRKEPITTRAPSLVAKTAGLQLIAALCSHLSITVLSPSIQTILLPLHNLTDPAIPAPYSPDEGFRTTYKALVSTSHEIMSLLQKKLGTTDYVAELSRVREGVKERREGRRVKRRLEAVAEPEKIGREKKRKGEKKREKRKERSGEERARRRGW